MGIAKKDLERQEEEQRHSGKFCIRCGCELTKDEVEYNKNFDIMDYLCSACRNLQDKLDKE